MNTSVMPIADTHHIGAKLKVLRYQEPQIEYMLALVYGAPLPEITVSSRDNLRSKLKTTFGLSGIHWKKPIESIMAAALRDLTVSDICSKQKLNAWAQGVINASSPVQDLCGNILDTKLMRSLFPAPAAGNPVSVVVAKLDALRRSTPQPASRHASQKSRGELIETKLPGTDATIFLPLSDALHLIIENIRGRPQPTEVGAAACLLLIGKYAIGEIQTLLAHEFPAFGTMEKSAFSVYLFKIQKTILHHQSQASPAEAMEWCKARQVSYFEFLRAAAHNSFRTYAALGFCKSDEWPNAVNSGRVTEDTLTQARMDIELARVNAKNPDALNPVQKTEDDIKPAAIKSWLRGKLAKQPDYALPLIWRVIFEGGIPESLVIHTNPVLNTSEKARDELSRILKDVFKITAAYEKSPKSEDWILTPNVATIKNDLRTKYLNDADSAVIKLPTEKEQAR